MRKFDRPPLFNPPAEKNFNPHLFSQPPPTKHLDPHLHFDNSITLYNIYYILLVKDSPKVPGVAARMGFEPKNLPIQRHRINQCATTPLLIGNCNKNY